VLELGGVPVLGAAPVEPEPIELSGVLEPLLPLGGEPEPIEFEPPLLMPFDEPELIELSGEPPDGAIGAEPGFCCCC
jgi:hypothetical protein